jgi:hypothetical protein
MKTAASSVFESAGHLRFQLLFAATYPLFLLAAVLQRRFAQQADDEADGLPEPRQSAFAEARESASIAISYALAARTTLQTFARRPRAERPS